MNVGKNDFIPTQQIIWFKEDLEDRNLNPDTDDMYER